MNVASSNAQPASHWKRFRTLYLILALCAAPVIASYTAYYFLPPSGRTNYGDLIEPQRPLPALTLHELDGRAVDAAALRGRWLMVQVDGGDCADPCQRKLWKMRQVRLTTGKDADRVERVWLISDSAPLPTIVMREYEGTRFLRASPAELASFLALPPDTDRRLSDHIWIIDPLGNLMLRWPKDADPSRMKRDLSKLLSVSGIG
ncbi:MAG: SCO family protein [Gemmatimonadota bacterium]